MKRLGQWLAESRVGRVAFGLGVSILFGTAVYILIHEEVGRQTRDIVQRVEVIERVEPEDVLRECLRERECRQVIRSVRERLESTERGDARQPAPSAGQQPEPGVRPGGSEGGKPQSERPSQPRRPNDPVESPSPDTPRPSPAPTPQSSSAPAPEPEPSAGNSGETPAAENDDGVRACVEVVVSACVDAPQLLP